jgi:5'-3' exoribonuclease 2
MCFLCGNDFIPHIPTLNIRDGGIDALLFLYKHVLPEMRGYITLNGDLNFRNLNIFVGKIGEIEEAMMVDQ